MRGHPIMISASSRNSWWPFVRVKYGFSDDQIRSYTGQRGPFLADRNSVIQDMISNGPYIVQKDTGMKVRTFMLTDIGYDPYGGILTVPQSLIDKNPAAVRCLVQGSQRGWEDFMRDPRPGFAEIRRISPEVSQGLLEFAYRVLRDNHLIETPDTRRLGFGAMTDERLSHHARTLFSTGVLPEGFDYRKAFNASFITPPPAAPSPPIGTPHP
jgi:NitT/TauT family transport system substrate-binding protein